MALALPNDGLTWVFLGGYLVSAVVSFGIAAYLIRTRGNRTATRYFELLAVSVGLWATLNSLRVLATSLAAKHVVHLVMYTFIFATPLLFLVFVLAYTGYDRWVTRRSVGALAIVPALGWLALLTNDAHRLFYERLWVDPSTGTPILASQVADTFWVFAGYNWLLFLAGSFLLVHFALVTHPRYRLYSAVLLVGVVIPWTGNVAYLSGIKPHPHLDPTPVFLALGVLPIAYVVRRSRMLDLIPLARDHVLETIEAAYIVVDEQRRIVDLDDAARTVVAPDASVVGLIGCRAPDVLPSTLWEASESSGADFKWERPADSAGERRHFLVRTRPISRDAGPSIGRVLTLTEITSQEEQRRALAEKTERLDEFAAILSHDLRNPLGVAKGRLELARSEVDSDHLEPAHAALERIERLVDATLEYATIGVTRDVSPVELTTAVEHSWDNVPTSDAKLRVEGSARILADAGTLPQVFENLFRNAIEHSEGPVTVTVGTLGDGGFFVEDDGPGIPAGERAAVFERGYSMDELGTGFGLSIVSQIADAHGWTLTLIDSSDGGARFEFTGVHFVA